MTLIEIRPNDTPIEHDEWSIKKGHSVATAIKSLITAGEWLKTEGIYLNKAELDTPLKNLIFIPSSPVKASHLHVDPISEGSPLGEVRWASTTEIGTPRRLAHIALNAESNLDAIVLDAITDQSTASSPSAKHAAKFDRFSFVLDEHTLALEAE